MKFSPSAPHQRGVGSRINPPHILTLIISVSLIHQLNLHIIVMTQKL